MAIRLDEGKIDASNPDNLSDKVLDEKTTRKKLLNHARSLGFEKEMMILFAEADKAMRLCGNDQERADIGKLFAVKVYNLLGGGGQLYVDGQLVADDGSGKEKSIYLPSGEIYKK